MVHSYSIINRARAIKVTVGATLITAIVELRPKIYLSWYIYLNVVYICVRSVILLKEKSRSLTPCYCTSLVLISLVRGHFAFDRANIIMQCLSRAPSGLT
jgi:hypothetical protein